MQMHNPPHPGSIIRDAIEALNMTVGQFATHIGVSRNTLSRILNGKGGITPDMSLRLSEAFGQPSGDIWFRMQGEYDYWQASQAKRKKISPLPRAA